MPGVRHPGRIALHLRVVLRDPTGRSVAFGPGKAGLLAAIEAAGSIAAAGQRLGISYKRAWSLVDALNVIFRRPLVDASKGGAHGGGAMLTPLGTRILAAYHALEATSVRSGQGSLGIIRRSLRSEK